jgi:serine/threonine protein kinase
MALSEGTRLGPYEIIAAIGAGGMGEVYRAKDSRLGRDVAIKVLPASFADDPDRRARFEREAQAVAALSHPNVIAVFDTGVHEGQLYVVMELLAGQTLRERLTTSSTASASALPVRKAVDIAVQIARGLGAAHGKAIVHRDLKPENIFLLDDGQVKILDFGLARQATSADRSGATQTIAATDPGTVMGTVGYMAPEQVRGQAVDARADLFAFGAVLYEMVSGQRAFQRDTAADTMTAILTQDPPELVGSRPDRSPALDRIIRHCLEKNANERFQSARDVAFALDAFSGTNVSSAANAALPAAQTLPRRRWLRAALVSVGAIALVAAGMLIARAMTPAASTPKFETKTWDAEWITNARFGPDGQTIVFSSARAGNVPRLYVIRSGGVISQPVGDPGTHLLAVSSTGELAVLTGARHRHHRLFAGTLSRMALDGAPRPLMTDVSEADWSPDGSKLAVIRTTSGSVRLEYPAGQVRYEKKAGYLSDLRVSPDDTQIAFFEHDFGTDDRGVVSVVDLRGGAVRKLTGEFWAEEGLAWSPDARDVLFSASSGQGGEVYQSLAVNVSGAPVVRQTVSTAGGMFVQDVARDGRVLTLSDDNRSVVRALVPGESAERDASWLDFANFGFLSRDGKWLAFVDGNQSAGVNYQTALRDMTTDRVLRLGEGLITGISPDGRWVSSVVPSTMQPVLYATGAGDAVKLGAGLNGFKSLPDAASWSPDSRHVTYCGSEAGKPPRCYTQNVPSGASKPMTAEGFVRAMGSEDGRSMLFIATDGKGYLAIDGGAPVPIKGLQPEDKPFGTTRDGALVVQVGHAVPARVERVDPTMGARTFIKLFAPPESSGVNEVNLNQWLDDGKGYTYSYTRELSRLYVVSGVK